MTTVNAKTNDRYAAVILALSDFIKDDYISAEDYPCLKAQIESLVDTRPLAGLTVIHSTPIFKNAIPKLISILETGAEVVFSCPTFCAPDSRVVEILREHGIPYFDSPGDIDIEADILIDCAGSLSHLLPRIGCVELTKSGVDYYRDATFPVIFIDDGSIKVIEDRFGTSDGFIRAMKELDYPIEGKSFVIFGNGKVGNGIAEAISLLDAKTTIIDIHPPPTDQFDSFDYVAGSDKEGVVKVCAAANYIITATGMKNLISDKYAYLGLGDANARLINMGAEDEFGPAIPFAKAENNKSPLNFLLPEPTRLRFLDPIFAIQNISAIDLLDKSLSLGLTPPCNKRESDILKHYRGKLT